MLEYHNGKLWCPACDQGFIRQALVKKTGDKIYVCEECDATWMKEETISKDDFVALGVFLELHHLPWSWDELTLLD